MHRGPREQQGIKGHRAGSQDARAESVTLGKRLFLSGPQIPVEMEWYSGSADECTKYPVSTGLSVTSSPYFLQASG